MNKTVVTSNQAAIWKSPQLAGIWGAVPGLEHLLHHYSGTAGVRAAQ